MNDISPLAEDLPETLHRFDNLPHLEKLLLWLCAYVDEPMDMNKVKQMFNPLIQRVLKKPSRSIHELKGMVIPLQKQGWLDESCRCPSMLVNPLFLKAMRSYFQQGRPQIEVREFERYLGPFYEPTESNAPARFRLLHREANRPKQRHPSNNILLVLVEILNYPSLGYTLINSLPLDGVTRLRRLLRDIRVALLQGDAEGLFRCCNMLQQLRISDVPVSETSFPIVAAFPPEFAEPFCAATSPDNQQVLYTEFLNKSIWYPVAERDRLLAGIPSRYLLNSEGSARKVDVRSVSIKLSRLMLVGKLSEARSIMESSGLKWPCHWGLVAFLQGSMEDGRQIFRSFLKDYGPLHVPWIEFTGCFLYFLQEIVRNETEREGFRIAKKIQKIRGMLPDVSLVIHTFFDLLMTMAPNPSLQHGDAAKQLREIDAYGSPLLEMFRLLCIFCLEGGLRPSEIRSLETLQKDFYEAGDSWLAMESAAMLIQAGSDEQAYRALIEEMRNKEGIVPFIRQLPIEASWKKQVRLVLETVRSLHSSAGKGAEAPGLDRRITWQLYIDKNGRPIAVQAMEQKRSKNGMWSSGRKIGIKRLQSDELKEIMTDQDRAIVACIKSSNGYYYSRSPEYWIDPVRAVVEMIGHPHVYSFQEPDRRLELVRADPELVARRKNGNVVLQIHPPSKGNDVLLVLETPSRIKVIVFNRLFLRVANLIGEDGIRIPESEKNVLTEMLSSLSAVMTVHSTVPFGHDQIEQVSSSPIPIVQVSPDGAERFRLNIFVRPFGPEGPLLRAGKGVSTIVSEINGKNLQAVRNLAEEKRLAEVIEDRLLALDSADGGGGEWAVDNPEDGLQMLADLRELQEKGAVVVEWPDGEKIKFSRPLSFDQVHLRIRSAADWFEIEGELQIDEAHVIGMKQLIELLAANPGRRFVPMEDGHFLALTAALRKRLDELSAFTEKRGKKLLLHGLAVAAVKEVVHPFGHVEAQPQWQERLKRIEEAMRLVPAIPSTLKAELREYQKEGFQWMARLAHLGCGACLADDMGLGKTVQALAMLLEKAAEGPSLVVAPMSVCANWIAEARRFAPTLRIHTLHAPDRKALVDGLGAMDLLVASYGLLHQEGEILAARPWNVIVLDEAQAIKNMRTRRYQAAVRLQGRFKLITTGTPVENHLGEFYTLFQFINPGLLGSKDRFNSRYAIPIEKEHDKQAQQRLRKLVKPFILRRLKSQVLEELPPRTDIVLRVELKPEEIALYEAMRQKAIEHIANMDGPIENRRFELLAEIMKLRQVCCHPKLVHPEFPDIGSKLEIFGEVVSDLLEGGHKALVFSQFLGHLALIRNYLDKAGIAYRYLDGQTPAKQRQQEIEAFQSGNGDLFLISLKAGGLGLNLTAADYVLHMDPWWNPAVEDQASDRAHRIGQSQPVTVYRLVAQGTIEEKIVKLHAEKRELAESLLEGTDTSARMGAEELLRLIREEA